MKAEILEALEIGLDCAIDVAADVHARMKGYKPHQHAAVDENIRKIQSAIDLIKSLPEIAP